MIIVSSARGQKVATRRGHRSDRLQSSSPPPLRARRYTLVCTTLAGRVVVVVVDERSRQRDVSARSAELRHATAKMTAKIARFTAAHIVADDDTILVIY